MCASNSGCGVCFLFSSRRRHTRCLSDWSSDVCSSDLVPFWLDRIKIRGTPPIPGARSFPDLNLRTYVRDEFNGSRGMYCFSMDASNLLAVAAARAFYHLPYYWSEMRLEHRSEREFSFYSRRRFTSSPVIFKARYRGLGPTRKLAENRSGTLEHFLTE